MDRNLAVPGTMLTKYGHFDAAAESGQHIEVYQDDELLDDGGPIQHHDLHKVTINGMHYIKTACAFVVR